MGSRTKLIQHGRFLSKDCLLGQNEVNLDPILWLYMKLGPKGFREFQRRFAGSKVWVPKYSCRQPCRYCPLRDVHIHLLRRQGSGVSGIAKRFDLTVKRIYEILKNSR